MSPALRPIYAAAQAQTRYINAATLVMACLVIAIGVVPAIHEDPRGALFGGLLFVAALGLIRLYYPRRYEVWPNHLAVVFLIGRWRISYDTIDIAYETLPAEHALATSLHGNMPWQLLSLRYGWFGARTVTVLRLNPRLLARHSAIIYPENRAEFLKHLHAAMRLHAEAASRRASDAAIG